MTSDRNRLDFERALRPLLAGAALPATEPKECPDPKPFDPCEPPSARLGPSFVVPFRQSLLGWPVDLPKERDGRRWEIACHGIADLDADVGFSLGLEQRWSLQGLSIGDLSSTIALAPLEELTLEVQASQRTRLEKSTVDSTEELRSSESTTVDKEVLNVARSASRTQNWHVDASGSFGIGDSKVSFSAGTSTTINQASQSSVQHITEATRKSANSLKTLHKVEVRGVTETFVSNRSVRRIRNPYRDRPLTVNVFQLIKHFAVETTLVEVRPAFFISIGGLVFDPEFVVANSEFLRQRLLDQGFVDELPTALAGAKPAPPLRSEQAATDAAVAALELLFAHPNIFRLPLNGGVDPNLPATSYNGSIDGNTALGDALANNLGTVFTTLNFFYAAYQQLVAGGRLREQAPAMAVALADGVSERWTTTENDHLGSVHNVLDEQAFTEAFRRLSGFLAMVKGVVKPLVQPALTDQQAIREREEAAFALRRLLQHLRCHSNYYTQQWLADYAAQTNNLGIIDLVDRVLDSSGMSSALRRQFDVERSFLDRQRIVVPAARPLTFRELGGFPGDTPEEALEAAAQRQVIDVELPADGFHLEVVAGRCRLDGLPPEVSATATIRIEDAVFEARAGAASSQGRSADE